MFSLITDLSKRSEAPLLALPFWEKPKAASPLSKSLDLACKSALEAKDFLGKEKDCLLLYPSGEKEKRLLLFGLGKEEALSVERVRRAYARVARVCRKKKIKEINLLLPNIADLRYITADECLRGVCEGLLSVNYSWSEKIKEEKESLLEKVTLIGMQPKNIHQTKKYEDIFEAVYFARDLINGDAHVVTPHYLGEAAKKLSSKFPSLHTTVFDRKQIEKEKMGLILAVGQGAANEPTFITVTYKGHHRSKDHTVIVGKGVTFDSGGLNLKPTGSMETMRGDMSGAAAVLGTMAAIAALGLKINVTGIIPSVENAIGSRSFRPGDVYPSYSGKSVEIGNTDAEGRLILADALAYAVKNLSPSRIINLATLTGAVSIALGEDFAGLMSNDDQLASDLLACGETTGELLWRLPLHPEYKEQLKSDIADLKNIGSGRSGGAIIGGLFLEAFVENIPWAHLDIAGCAFLAKEKPTLPKNGVGVGVRLLIEYLNRPSA